MMEEEAKQCKWGRGKGFHTTCASTALGGVCLEQHSRRGGGLFGAWSHPEGVNEGTRRAGRPTLT
jgi:hypothetical protein